jgi:hypothetical protein
MFKLQLIFFDHFLITALGTADRAIRMASSMGISGAKDWAKAALRLPPVDSIGLAGDKMPSKSKAAIESFAGFIYSCLSNHLLTLPP